MSLAPVPSSPLQKQPMEENWWRGGGGGVCAESSGVTACLCSCTACLSLRPAPPPSEHSASAQQPVVLRSIISRLMAAAPGARHGGTAAWRNGGGGAATLVHQVAPVIGTAQTRPEGGASQVAYFQRQSCAFCLLPGGLEGKPSNPSPGAGPACPARTAAVATARPRRQHPSQPCPLCREVTAGQTYRRARHGASAMIGDRASGANGGPGGAALQRLESGTSGRPTSRQNWGPFVYH